MNSDDNTRSYEEQKTRERLEGIRTYQYPQAISQVKMVQEPSDTGEFYTLFNRRVFR
jgi:hypothetical protein